MKEPSERDLQKSGVWASTLPNMPPTLSRPVTEAAETLLGLLRSALAILIGPAPFAPPVWRCRASAPGMAPTEPPTELAAVGRSFLLREHTL